MTFILLLLFNEGIHFIYLVLYTFKQFFKSSYFNLFYYRIFWVILFIFYKFYLIFYTCLKFSNLIFLQFILFSLCILFAWKYIPTIFRRLVIKQNQLLFGLFKIFLHFNHILFILHPQTFMSHQLNRPFINIF